MEDMNVNISSGKLMILSYLLRAQARDLAKHPDNRAERDLQL